MNVTASENLIRNHERQATLEHIHNDLRLQGVFGYLSHAEPDKFVLITEIDDQYFNAEVKRGFGRASHCRILIAELLQVRVTFNLT